MNVPVLAAGSLQSQIQIPFEASGSGVSLTLESPAGRWTAPLPLRATSPSIFLDDRGSAMLLNGDTGIVLDPSTPLRSGSRVQIIATGLGVVRPEWPAGVAAPASDPPRVVAQVRVILDREPLAVSRASLAPGYIGLYLIEAELPAIVNAGTAELSIEADGVESNRVRVFLAN